MRTLPLSRPATLALPLGIITVAALASWNAQVKDQREQAGAVVTAVAAGRDFGYRARSDEAARAPAVARWRAWWHVHGLRIQADLPPPIPITRSVLAAPLSVRDVDGRSWSLAALRGHRVVLCFMGTW